MDSVHTQTLIERSTTLGLFDSFAAIDKATRTSAELKTLELADGDNRFRIIGKPEIILKHWDLPGEATAVACLKQITDPAAFAANPQEYLDAQPPCPYCDYNAEHPKEAVRRVHWCMNVVQERKVKVDGKDTTVFDNLLADFSQRSIIKGIAEIEESEDWKELMGPNGISDLLINIKKTGKELTTRYAVGAVPTSKPLTAEQLAEINKGLFDIRAIKIPSEERAATERKNSGI